MKRRALVAAVALLLLLLGLTVAPSMASAQDDGEDSEEVDVEMRSTPICTKYRPTHCWYHVSDPEQPPHIPACMAGHTCGFDLKKRLKCPFWAAGRFVTEEAEECSTRFVEQVARPRPTCDTSCCTSDPGPGRWIADPHAPGHKVFKPDSGCSYFQYSRGEVLEYFQGEATDILVVGDSFMRQLFVRLLHLLRGQERVVDYKIHTHAAYAVCDAADAFEVAPAYTAKLAANKDAQYKSVNSFFFTHNVTGRHWASCSALPMQVNYLFGSTFRQQVRNLERYARGGYSPHTRVDVIISVMFWTHEWETPREWLDALTAFRAQNFVRRVFMLGIPTTRVDPKKTGYVEAYQNRNRMMREWAANQTSDAYYIDFDALARGGNVPAACEGSNKHWACHLRSLYGGEEGGVNYFREPHLQVPLGDFFSSEDGQCYDDMNAAVWQLYFNVAMKESTADGEDELPGARRRRHTRNGQRSGLKPRQPAAGLGGALEAATDKFVDRVMLRGVT